MKPLPTTYGGITYRSRVEARWAVFFEAMEWPAAYEQEGLDLDGVWYLPDFWLPQFGVYVEIKAADPTEEEVAKCRRLAELSGKTVWLLAGSPSQGAYKILEFEPGKEAEEADTNEFRDCRRCERATIFYSAGGGSSYGWREIGEPCKRADCGDRVPGFYGRVDVAVRRASAERFGVHE